MLGQQFGEVLLVDGDSAVLEGLYSGFVFVDTDNPMTHLRKTNGRYQSNISGADDTDGNLHRHDLLSPRLCLLDGVRMDFEALRLSCTRLCCTLPLYAASVGCPLRLAIPS
jgi:hypothetical protein